jgi:riboflavin synthase
LIFTLVSNFKRMISVSHQRFTKHSMVLGWVPQLSTDKSPKEGIFTGRVPASLMTKSSILRKLIRVANETNDKA